MDPAKSMCGASSVLRHTHPMKKMMPLLIVSLFLVCSISCTPFNVPEKKEVLTAEGLSLDHKEDEPLPFRLIAADSKGAPLSYAIVTPPEHGELRGTAPVLSYIPHINFHGTDTFIFSATNGSLSDVAQVTLNVISVNDSPVPNTSLIETVEDTPTEGTLMATDADQDSLSYSLVSGPSKGSLVINNEHRGTFRYTPNQNAFGIDSFTFKAFDGVSYSEPQVITINITPQNDTPIAQDGNIQIIENATIDGQLVATDIDEDTLIFFIVRQPTKGILSSFDPATGSYRYVATPDTYGTDSFTFRVFDGTAYSPTKEISVSISQAEQTIFVSSKLYSGNLGGQTGANGLCQALADGAGQRGSWQALLYVPFFPDLTPLSRTLKNLRGNRVTGSSSGLFWFGGETTEDLVLFDESGEHVTPSKVHAVSDLFRDCNRFT